MAANTSITTERKSNFELLRIICMLMIIAGHVIMVKEFESTGYNNLFRCGVRPFFMVAVNCFVIISGWFGINFTWKKVLKLNNITTLYSIVIAAVFLFMGGSKTIDIQSTINVLFPVFTKQYWFITIYVVLMLISPFLNLLIESLTTPVYKRMLWICTVLFVFLPTVAAVLNFRTITLDAGYGLTNFVFLYLLGRFMRLHHPPKRKARVYAFFFIVSMLICGVFQMTFSYIMGFEFTTLMSYDTFFVFFGALMLFCSFSRLDFQNKTINYIASFAFPVYIIHIHPWTFGWVFGEVMGIKRSSDQNFYFFLLLLPLITYAVCMGIEWIRRVISFLLVKWK